jgi:UDP-N-acetylmuramoylalanine--D-glutamate ligase
MLTIHGFVVGEWLARASVAVQRAEGSRERSFLRGRELIFREQVLLNVDEMKLRGTAQRRERCGCVCRRVLRRARRFESMNGTAKRFDPVEHRLEFVAEIDGVKFYNDSKATSVDATLKALEAFATRPGKLC